MLPASRHVEGLYLGEGGLLDLGRSFGGEYRFTTPREVVADAGQLLWGVRLEADASGES